MKIPSLFILATLVAPALLGAEPPALPAGLGTAAEPERAEDEDGEALFSGFVETRLGTRLREDDTQKDASLGEARVQLQWDQDYRWGQISSTADLVFDPVLDDHSFDLDAGEGWLELRELNALLHPSESTDLKAGRQILTWGTGDLLFINDLFPKDWNAFLIGRDEEYLKAPSDALKLSFYADLINLDLVYTPVFDADRFVDGRRLSYFNPRVDAIVGREYPVNVIERDREGEDGEIALRAHRLWGAAEMAAYYYRGFWKSPAGMDPATGLSTFPRLAVYGASVRGPMAGGIGYAEVGFYDSRDDNSGTDPLIRNSEWRFLLGFERELAPELTGAVQLYRESMTDHGAYRSSLATNAFVKDRHRDLVTLRLTQTLINQRLTLSLFNFWSPSEEDGYVRAKANYKASDHWIWEVGTNVFYGDQVETFFGQLKDNSNLYIALRYGF
ncbi:hypothetical protein FKG94_16220 [Exilibacterium tricleocarpae]|uniref:DUF1302 domain-containing protein n=1 Tax=Exilibacterium tricleocarpae TaxID=2591008 RepID=A0A545TAD2_9GAMM|nr:hypothetical protein [Exilibacterium tricleocarpae]TQV74154.1 hypothetical protein FKG94_16220 [Exilibacterium tricleocarpae]